MTFIDSISASLFCFPSSLSWIVNQLYIIVSNNKNFTASSLDQSGQGSDVRNLKIQLLFFNKRQLELCIFPV